jgi:hypothetical protein
MQTHQVHVSDGRNRVHEIRTELFAFPEVLDVFVTGRPDALVVVYLGRPRPGEWLRALHAAGYRVPPRRRALAEAPKVDSVRESHRGPRPIPTATAAPSSAPRPSPTRQTATASRPSKLIELTWSPSC